jgi:hypothetical protein
LESCQPDKRLEDKKKILSCRYDWEHFNNATLGKRDASRHQILRLTVNYNVKMEVKEIRYEIPDQIHTSDDWIVGTLY